MPCNFFQYLVEMCRVFVAAELAGRFDKQFGLLVIGRLAVHENIH